MLSPHPSLIPQDADGVNAAVIWAREVRQVMGVCRGNKGNLMQHWVLCETLARLQMLLPVEHSHLLLVTTHSMAPWSVPRKLANPQADYSRPVFDAVRQRAVPQRNSVYETAWHNLSVRHGIPYPSSAAFAVNVWPGDRRLSLLLCEANPSVADEIDGWLSLPETIGRLQHRTLHRGNWQLRFAQPLAPQNALPDAIYVEMDPMRFEGHPPAQAARNDTAALYIEELNLVAAALIPLQMPVVIQISSFSANNNNPHDNTVAAINGVLIPAGFSLQARVEADGNMISLIYVRGLGLWDSPNVLHRQFVHWV
jgi:hypothetical protein